MLNIKRLSLLLILCATTSLTCMEIKDKPTWSYPKSLKDIKLFASRIVLYEMPDSFPLEAWQYKIYPEKKSIRCGVIDQSARLLTKCLEVDAERATLFRMPIFLTNEFFQVYTVKMRLLTAQEIDILEQAKESNVVECINHEQKCQWPTFDFAKEPMIIPLDATTLVRGLINTFCNTENKIHKDENNSESMDLIGSRKNNNNHTDK